MRFNNETMNCSIWLIYETIFNVKRVFKHYSASNWVIRSRRSRSQRSPWTSYPSFWYFRRTRTLTRWWPKIGNPTSHFYQKTSSRHVARRLPRLGSLQTMGWSGLSWKCFAMHRHLPKTVYNMDVRTFELWNYDHDRNERNKWREVTISLRTGGQGHPTPIHIPSLPHTQTYTESI